MSKVKLDREVEKIRDFITPSYNQFGGTYLSMSSNFTFNCSNDIDKSDNCYNLKLASTDDADYVLDKLIIETNSEESKEDLIKRFIENSDCDKTNEFYLQIFRRF